MPAGLVGGQLTERFELTLGRVVDGGPPRYDQPLLLADVIPKRVRRFTNFSGDLSGRYVGALAVAADYAQEPGVSLGPLVAEILRHQKPDGHFGDPMSVAAIDDDDMARLWGNGRLLIGLLEYHRRSAQPEVLAAARRIGDFLVSAAPRFQAASVQRHFSKDRLAVGYICWTQNIEGLVELYRQTSDGRYLALAGQMAERTAMAPGQHTHGLLSSLRGMLELGLATGDGEWLRRVEQQWQALADSENLLIQGAVPEYLAPGIKRDEGCAEADWLRLNLALWRQTGARHYLEHAERTLFNEFALNQFETGDFGHVVLAPNGLDHGFARAWWCCTLHGLRAFPEVFRSVFRAEGSTLAYDLPVDGQGQADGLKLRAGSSLERDQRIALEVLASDGERHGLAVRLPAWAGGITATLGGEALVATEREGYLLFERRWQTGEVLTLEYRLRTRLVRDPEKRDRIAIFHGPWLLGVSEQRSPFFFDEPHGHNQVLLPEPAEGDEIALTPLPVEAARDLEIPVARHQLRWAPAGYPEQVLSAALVPIAERTNGNDSLRWEFWFRAGEGGESGGEPETTLSQPSVLPWVGFIVAGLLMAGFAWRRVRARSEAGRRSA